VLKAPGAEQLMYMDQTIISEISQGRFSAATGLDLLEEQDVRCLPHAMLTSKKQA
jgi:hypothetical protein